MGKLREICRKGLHKLEGDNIMIKNKKYNIRACKACHDDVYQRYKKSGLKHSTDVVWDTLDRAKNPEKYHDKELRRNYNITLDQYNSILTSQHNRCAICKIDKPGMKTTRFSVDHDHACCPEKRKCCGKCVRALLCTNCNLMLGIANDDPNLLQNMIDYLAKFGKFQDNKYMTFAVGE